MRPFKIKPADENTVYLLSIPGSTQVTAMLMRTDEIAVPGNTVRGRLLSRYSGQLAFSELREKQSLGYMAGAYYSVPGILPDNYSLWNVYLGTQADKLETGLDSMLAFSNTMPCSEELFEASKENALSVLRASRIHPENLYDVRADLLRLKRPLDVNLRDFKAISAMTADEFFADAAKHVNNGKNVIVLTGAVEKLSQEMLKKYGKVITLTPDMLLVK